MTETRDPLRSPQCPAILLRAAAGLGLLLANLPTHDAVAAVLHAHLPVAGLDLSVGHWISDGLLAVFFFVVAVELQYELTTGELRSFRRAVQPAIAAAGGILVPIAVYLLVAGPLSADGSSASAGWPVPTATDIAFALGLLAVFGRGLPSGVRIFLLALAILDDIVGIVFIAVLFAHDLQWGWFLAGLVCVAAFGMLSRLLGLRVQPLVVAGMLVTAVLAWGFVAASGVHATIAGVLLGLAMAQSPALRARAVLEPWVNGAILPLFAFTAAFVAIPAVSSGLSGAFWGIVIALPLGKLVGITAFGWAAMRLRPRGTPPALRLPDLVVAGLLGGIGFTVSLLLANLAFADDAATRDQAILGVLAGSLIALVLSGFFVSARARWHRRLIAATE